MDTLKVKFQFKRTVPQRQAKNPQAKYSQDAEKQPKDPKGRDRQKKFRDGRRENEAYIASNKAKFKTFREEMKVKRAINPSFDQEIKEKNRARTIKSRQKKKEDAATKRVTEHTRRSQKS